MDYETLKEMAMKVYSPCEEHQDLAKEFKEDFDMRVFYVSRLLRRWADGEHDLNLRLLVNHIIIIQNCFTVPVARKIVLLKTPDDLLPYALSVLSHLKYLDFDEDFDWGDVPIDFDLIEALDKL